MGGRKSKVYGMVVVRVQERERYINRKGEAMSPNKDNMSKQE